MFDDPLLIPSINRSRWPSHCWPMCNRNQDDREFDMRPQFISAAQEAWAILTFYESYSDAERKHRLAKAGKRLEEELKAYAEANPEPYWPQHDRAKYNRMSGSYETLEDKYGQ
jgi:hypothetical protein